MKQKCWMSLSFVRGGGGSFCNNFSTTFPGLLYSCKYQPVFLVALLVSRRPVLYRAQYVDVIFILTQSSLIVVV